MPRKRQIKPTIFGNEELGAESTDPLIMLLFEALWCLADREGRLEDRPWKIVKGFAFPYRNINDPDFMLQWLHDHGFIIRYSVQGQRYIQIVNFTEHQRGSGIHPNEIPSVIPPPTDTYRTDHLGGPKALRSSASSSSSSSPSSPSFPSLENGGLTPPVEKDPIERRIWEDGIELLCNKARMKESAARPLLGRLAQQYSKRLLAEAIAATQAENPAEPKSFLIGVLRQRSNPNPGLHVGKSPDSGDQSAERPVECRVCCDTGEAVIHSNDVDAIGGVKLIPCPECSNGTKANE